MLTEIYQPKQYEYEFTAQQAQEMRQKRAELMEESKKQSALRESVKGQAKRPYTKRVKELDAEIDLLCHALEQSPPEPVSNEQAITRIKKRINSHYLDYVKAKSDAKKAIDNGTLWWSSHNLENLIANEFVSRYTSQLLDHTDMFELYESMYRLYKDVFGRVINSANIYNSTSEIDNVISMIEHQVHSKLIRRDLLWWLKECERLCEQVKAYESLRETKED